MSTWHSLTFETLHHVVILSPRLSDLWADAPAPQDRSQKSYFDLKFQIPLQSLLKLNTARLQPKLSMTSIHRLLWCHSHWDLVFMQNLNHLNWDALGFMIKLSTYNPPLLQHQHGQFFAPPQPGPVVSSRSAGTHSQATSTPSTDAALSTSNSRTQACTATASSTASDRTTHNPTTHSTTATGTADQRDSSSPC